MKFFSVSLTGPVALTILLSASMAQSAEPLNAPLIEGMGVTVTGRDIQGEASRLPPPGRKELVSRPESVSQLTSNLYVRRALAAEAIAAGIEKDPNIQALLAIARDRVLSDARLSVIDKANMPNDAAASQFAKEAYQADPKRFSAPEEVRVRQILIKGSSADARVKAEKLLAEIQGGADFETVAKKNSDDPVTADRGGDVGYFGKDQMVKSFEDAAFELKKSGDVSPVIESQFGFHIIKLVDRRAPGIRPFSEVEASLKDEAVNKTVSAARQAEVSRILEKAKFDKTAIEAFVKAER